MMSEWCTDSDHETRWDEMRCGSMRMMAAPLSSMRCVILCCEVCPEMKCTVPFEWTKSNRDGLKSKLCQINFTFGGGSCLLDCLLIVMGWE